MLSFSHAKRTRLLTAAMLLASLATGVVWACNIPVFRYALERWKPDAAECLVFYRGSLSPSQQTLLARLEAAAAGPSRVNARVRRVNLSDSPQSEYADLWKQLEQSADAELPRVVVRTKIGGERFANHWHGPLQRAASFPLFRSPVRDEIRDRLLAGHSVVWLLVRSKDAERTAQARKLLDETLPTLAAKIDLPEGIGLPGSELYADIPVLLKFSVIEVGADDPREAYLASLLTGIRGTAYADGEPLAVPVFGRGRALEVIPGDSLSADLIEQLTVFLSGACSCQVKEQNPGFDLLINADWDDQLFGGIDNRPPDRASQEGRNRPPTLLTIPPGRN